jgi:hypothetical protein
MTTVAWRPLTDARAPPVCGGLLICYGRPHLTLPQVLTSVPIESVQARRLTYHGAVFGWRRLLRVRGPGMPTAPAPFGRCHSRAVFTVERKHAVEAGEVHPRFRHQRCQPGNEIERVVTGTSPV